MNELLSLRAGLLDLLLLLDEEQCPLILGGGFGLFLRREHLRQTAERTLLERWPEARSTNDLDLFLRPELLCDSERVGRLSQAIRELGYRSIPGCEHYQFRKDDPEGNIERGLKIDLLTGPESLFDGTGVRTGARRAKPRPSVDLHAHTTNEAVTLVDDLQRIELTDRAVVSADQPVRSAFVWLPHPFTYLVMKLFAFRDRRHDVSQDRGSHHALDLYSIVAMTTESQWDQSCELRRRHRELPAIIEAAGIVQQLFSASDSLGMLILQGNPYCVDLQLEEFRATLVDLFRAS